MSGSRILHHVRQTNELSFSLFFLSTRKYSLNYLPGRVLPSTLFERINARRIVLRPKEKTKCAQREREIKVYSCGVNDCYYMSIHKSKTRQPIPHAGREKSSDKMDGLNGIERKKKTKQKKYTQGSPQTRQLLVYTTTTGPWPVWQMFGGFSCSFLSIYIYVCVWASLLFGWIVHANLTMFSRAGPTHDTPTHRLRQSFRERLCWQTENNEEEQEEVGCPFCFFPPSWGEKK